jgi:SAM-dependent methyltransferase
LDSVTALDLQQPRVSHPKVTCVSGDLTRLSYPDRSFDVVFCTEALEHIPALEQAVSELKRVVKHAVVIGVSYKQDIRIGRTTCVHCGKIGPPWGHIHVFDEERMVRLVQPFRLSARLLTGLDTEKTNALGAWCTDKSRNPYGITSRASNACIAARQ